MVTQEERNRILQAAVDTYGAQAQVDILVEECAELIQAISKFKRFGTDKLSNVHEEIADVQIMIDQMRLIFFNEAICQQENDKLIRLADRLNIRREAPTNV